MIPAPFRSTYRLQLTPERDFAHMRAHLDALERLGVGALYLSPVFESVPGSEHGYDVVDPTRVRAALGGRSGLESLAADAHERGMGIVLDLVPNHMAAHADNPWWWDVLTFGAASPHARMFALTCPGTRDEPITLPVLGSALEDVVGAGQLQLGIHEHMLAFRHHEHRVPLTPASWALALRGADDPLQDLRARCDAVDEADIAAARALQRHLRERLDAEPAFAGALHSWLDSLPARDPERVLALVRMQPHRLVSWRRTGEGLGYRRFFDITGLVGVRVEDPAVFATTHALVGDLLERGVVDAVRIDHVDGLRDPAGYLDRLAAFVRERAGGPRRILVEKILAPGERLPASWPVDGTTGYDFLAAAGRLFVRPEGFARLVRAYALRTGLPLDFDSVTVVTKRHVARALFAFEVGRLARSLPTAPDGARLDEAEATEAVIGLTAHLPVYRTYATSLPLTGADRRRVDAALAAAGSAATLPAGAETHLRAGLLGEAAAEAWTDWVLDWQQLSGAVMAKAVEDTAFYLYVPLAALAEVGDEPAPLAAHSDGANATATFHAFCAERRRSWPGTANATSTHDTKRAEDVRARLAVLSEIAPRWEAAVERWTRAHAHLRTEGAPDASEEWLIYQTLLGAWPAEGPAGPEFLERMDAYLLKALREAKVNTAWRDPDPEHEAAVQRFARALLDPRRASGGFRAEFEALAADVAFHGALNSLTQLVLRAAAPGVPDVYRGTELWDLSLVDPDNRRPLDYDARDAALTAAEREAPATLLARWPDGHVKTQVLARTLAARRQHGRLLLEGSYLPLPAEGSRARHALAFARILDDAWALALVPRWTTALTARPRAPLGDDVWDGTHLPLPDHAPRRWRNLLDGAVHTVVEGDPQERAALSVGALLSELPVALLVGEVG